MADVDDLEPFDDGDEEETEFATIAGGATIEEAKRKALEQLRKVIPSFNEADVEFAVMEEGSRGGFFGRGKSAAQVEARLRPSAERVRSRAATFLKAPRRCASSCRPWSGSWASRRASAPAKPARPSAPTSAATTWACSSGATEPPSTRSSTSRPSSSTATAASAARSSWTPKGTASAAKSALQSLADRTAQKVARESVSVALKPMSAAERKVIHLHLKDHARVETVSEGNEPFRAVVVYSKALRPLTQPRLSCKGGRRARREEVQGARSSRRGGAQSRQREGYPCFASTSRPGQCCC